MSKVRTLNGIPLVGQTLDERINEETENLEAMVSLMKRLILAARQPTAHGSCENGKDCDGCQAVREARDFVLAMRT